MRTPEEVAEAWASLSSEERVEAFRELPRGHAGTFFLERTAPTQAMLLRGVQEHEKRPLMRMLAPDDAADVLQEMPPEERGTYLQLLDDRARSEVVALLAHAEDDAGGLMNPRFVRVRADMTVDEAISYVRRQTRERAETIQYLYVLDQDQRLLGVLSFRDLLTAPGPTRVSEVMTRDPVRVQADTDQEEVARVIAKHDLVALPVVDASGKMVGIVTVDDVVDVVQAEATEDIQKIGGQEALDKPYLQNRPFEMVRKRAPWLAVLFLGEMLAIAAMARYEAEIEAAVVLALFVPLIISSGGNSGSQATTLLIRAMALGEVKLRDWWRVLRRELLTGLLLGLILAALGIARILLWASAFGAYGGHEVPLAVAVGIAIVGVVTWGTLAGSMLPFALRRFGYDPAAASAPLVATLVDVTGLLIYFNVARVVLSGTLL